MHLVATILCEPCFHARAQEKKLPWATVRTVVRWGALLLLVTLFVFAHGCHGDEDHELFGNAARIAQ